MTFSLSVIRLCDQPISCTSGAWAMAAPCGVCGAAHAPGVRHWGGADRRGGRLRNARYDHLCRRRDTGDIATASLPRQRASIGTLGGRLFDTALEDEQWPNPA